MNKYLRLKFEAILNQKQKRKPISPIECQNLFGFLKSLDYSAL
jgi:hypothetical protein